MKHIKDKRTRFWIIPVAIIAASLLLTAVGAPLLWAALDNYETSTPLHGIRVFYDRLARGDLTLADDAGFVPSAFADKEMYIELLREQFGSAESDYLYARIEEESDTPTACRYDIYRDNKRLGTLRLTAQSPHGPWTAHADVQIFGDITVTAPAFASVSVNGKVLGAAQETARQPQAQTDALGDFVNDMPQTVTYTVSGLLKAPTVTATADGTACEVEADGTHYAVTAFSQDGADLQQRVRQVAHLYAYYISKDATFAELKPHMVQNTPFYKSAKAYNNYWYNKHLSVEFANEKISDIVMLSTEIFTADISFDYIVKRTHDTNIYPTAYRCLFIKAGDAWLLLDLKML